MDLNKQSVLIYEANKEKGFWSENPLDRNFGEMIALCHSELSESLEAKRKNRHCSDEGLDNACNQLFNTTGNFKEVFEVNVKDTVEDELADAMIRILDYCGAMKIDIESHIRLKIAYNASRPAKHGKDF